MITSLKFNFPICVYRHGNNGIEDHFVGVKIVNTDQGDLEKRCDAKVTSLDKENKNLKEDIFKFVFTFGVVLIIFLSHQKFMSVALLSQAKKSECGIAQPSSCNAVENVLNERYAKS